MTHNLIVSPPGGEPTLYEMNANRIGVGRSPDNQIQLDLDCISYNHLELSRDDEGCYNLRDGGSKNGTRLNGFSIQASKLEDGDRILLAETIPCYYVELDGADEPPPAVAPAPESDQKAAAQYVTLQDKLQALEEKLDKLQFEVRKKQEELDYLKKAIDELKEQIQEQTDSGADLKTIEKLQADLDHKTKRVSILKDDLDGAKEKVKTLEATRKIAIKSTEAQSGPQGLAASLNEPAEKEGAVLPQRYTGPVDSRDKPRSPAALPKKPLSGAKKLPKRPTIETNS